jgi:type I restriction enzyme S subunit
MSKWPFAKLGSLAEFKNGLNFSRDNWGKGLKVIGVPDFQDYLYPKYDEVAEINPTGVVRDGDYLEEGDILFVRSNGNRDLIGRTLFVKKLPEKMSHSGFTIRLRFRSDKVFKPFYVYLFKSSLIRAVLSVYGGGTNINNLNQQILSKLDVPMPPLTVQKKVAAILSAYDELIENNKRRIALLEKLAEEIYREWFVRLRFPGHEKVEVVKGVPSGWQVRTLGSFASEVKRGVKKKDLPDDEKYIGLEHIPRRSIAIKEWATADTVDSNKLLFNERDILFGKIRPYLHKVALAHISGACSTDTIVIRPKDKVYEGYLLFTVFSDTFIELATVASKGTKMPRADWDFLRKLELAIPDEKLLELYQAQFATLFSQIVNLLRENELLAGTRDQLLSRLISGKLSVENLDIQFPPGMAEELEPEPTAAIHA